MHHHPTVQGGEGITRLLPDRTVGKAGSSAKRQLLVSLGLFLTLLSIYHVTSEQRTLYPPNQAANATNTNDAVDAARMKALEQKIFQLKGENSELLLAKEDSAKMKALEQHILELQGKNSKLEKFKDEFEEAPTTQLPPSLPLLTGAAKENNDDNDHRITTTTEEELDFWKNTAENCFYVEDLCHIGHNWFYREQNYPTQAQPLFSLNHKRTLPDGYPNIITVKPGGIPDDLQCSTSPIAHHLIIYAIMNHMMGDFLHGAMFGLKHLLDEHPDIPEDQLQFYLHATERHKLFDGHRIFLSTLPSSNPILGFNELLDLNRCRCLPRATFCGYEHEKDTQPSDNKYEPAGQISSNYLKNTSTKTQETRQNILHQVYKNPFFADMVLDFRRETLKRHKINPNEEASWKILGLGQRGGRRRWLNLDEVRDTCNQHYRDSKILCVEMNVELPSSHVIRQAVMHAALNGFIGIHGSQLVDALFMPKGSSVLELLPWFPFQAWGSWTRNTAGLAHHWFEKTDLNHYGYPLGRPSTAHMCNETINSADINEDMLCWKRLQQSDFRLFMWDNRDYIVDWPILEYFIAGFVVNPIESCSEVPQRQQQYAVGEGNERKQFTAYNVNCKTDTGSADMSNQYMVYTTNHTQIEEAQRPVKSKQFEEWLVMKNITI